MTLYSYNSEYPRSLPERVRLPNGETRTSLSQYTDAELATWGLVKVLAEPVFDKATHNLGWDGTNWSVTPKTPEQLASLERKKKKAVRDEGDRRIEVLYEEWEVVQAISLAFLLVDKGKANWTAQDTNRWNTTQAMWSAVRDIRQAQNTLQNMDPVPDDYTSDTYWP